mmetsp:Transcript_3717/g.10240  ORF Transcript_3717/g.10240 Transcript_3717/m.10240 type:complete len:384 (+) Transcript_3717:30-1181(+)
MALSEAPPLPETEGNGVPFPADRPRNGKVLVMAGVFLALLVLNFSSRNPVHAYLGGTVAASKRITAPSQTPAIQQPHHHDDENDARAPPRYAIAHYADRDDHVYGIYSIHQQLKKFNMSNHVSHVAVVPKAIDPRLKTALQDWLGKENVRVVDNTVLKVVPRNKGLWWQTFNKLLIFNLIEFDKVIMMDSDILIRTNILHWFNHGPTPCGVQAKDDVALNSGTMLITPNATVFQHMLEVLPKVSAFESDPVKNRQVDPLCGQYSDQDFLSAYFTRNQPMGQHRCILPTESAVLSSSIPIKGFQYYVTHRSHLFETVHFTTDKPWRGRTAPTHWFLCQVMREFNQSMEGMTGLPPIANDYLRACPPPGASSAVPSPRSSSRLFN